jgi:tetratricopeptide (TPR) repeat protein
LAVALGFCAGSLHPLCAADPPATGPENRVEGILAAGEQAHRDGRFQEAITLYSHAAKIGAPPGQALLGRGMAHEMANQPDKAVEDYKRTIEADPKNYKAMENLAGIWERSGRHIPEAIELYRRAVKLDPRSEWQENLAVWAKMLETRLRSENSSPVTCWHKGNDRVVQGDLDSAKAAYSKAIALNPDMFQAYYGRGLVRMKQGDLSGALKDFDEAVRLSPTLRGCLIQRGLAYEQLGDFQKALDDFSQAAHVDPRDPHAFYQRGRMLEQDGNPEAALQSYQAAMLLKPKPELLKPLLERIGAVCAAGNLNRKTIPAGSKNLKGLW